MRFRVQQDESLAIWRSPAHRPPSFDAHFRPLRQRCARAHEAHRRFTLGFAHDEGVFVHGESIFTRRRHSLHDKKHFSHDEGDILGRRRAAWGQSRYDKNASTSRRTLPFLTRHIHFFTRGRRFSQEEVITRISKGGTGTTSIIIKTPANVAEPCLSFTRRFFFSHDGRIFTRRTSYTDVGGRHGDAS